MSVKILAVGDICGEPGLSFLEKRLRDYRKENNIDFVVVNGENANVVGITPRQADAILRAGADVITLGNHTWTRTELQPYLDERKKILRPANFAPQCPGRGIDAFKTPFGDVCVLNLMGRFTLDSNTDNPFVIADGYMEEIREKIGADSLGYMKVELLKDTVGDIAYCDACFTGNYPMEVPNEDVSMALEQIREGNEDEE